MSDCIEETQCKGNLQFWWSEAHNPSDGNIVFGGSENPDSSVDSCCFYSWTSKIQLRWQKTAGKQLSVLPCTRFLWFVSVPHGASLGSWPSFSPKLWEISYSVSWPLLPFAGQTWGLEGHKQTWQTSDMFFRKTLLGSWGELKFQKVYI